MVAPGGLGAAAGSTECARHELRRRGTRLVDGGGGGCASGNLPGPRAAQAARRPDAVRAPLPRRAGGGGPRAARRGARHLGGAARGAAGDRIGLIDQYFGVMLAVVAALAGASALRYYLVTVLGERVVADLRTAVFAHITALSADFFDTAKTGEMVSRLTADTTQIKATVGASVSIALRNLLLFVGGSAMMVVTSPRLSG